MNKTKRALLIAVIILDILYAGLNIYLIVDSFRFKVDDILILSLVYDFVSLFACLASAGCLIYSIWDKGIFFSQRNGYYMTALIISICINLTSLSTILLIITIFMPDIVWVRPADDVYFKKEEPKEENNEDSKEKKIEHLRRLRDSGKITEEEFKEELFKLL